MARQMLVDKVRTFLKVLQFLFDDGFCLARELLADHLAIQASAETDFGNPLILRRLKHRAFTVWLSCSVHYLVSFLILETNLETNCALKRGKKGTVLYAPNRSKSKRKKRLSPNKIR